MQPPFGVDLHDLPLELRTLVEDELDRDERLVWVDQPLPLAYARRYRPVQFAAIPAFIAALVVAGVSVAVLDKKGPQGGWEWIGVAALLPALGGVALLLAPVWGRRTARDICYAITNRRAILLRKRRRGLVVQSFRPAQLAATERRQRPDGSGDLIFARETYAVGGFPEVQESGFLGVADVKRVEELIAELAGNDASSVAN